jgi:hypothetical protein
VTFGTLSADELEIYKHTFADALTEEITKLQARHHPCAAHLAALFSAVQYGIPCLITAHGTDLMG